MEDSLHGQLVTKVLVHGLN